MREKTQHLATLASRKYCVYNKAFPKLTDYVRTAGLLLELGSRSKFSWAIFQNKAAPLCKQFFRKLLCINI